MPAVTAYLCPWTKSLFRDKRKYVLHLRRHRSNVLLVDVRHRRALAAMNDMYKLTSAQAIAEWIEANPQPFFDNAMYGAFASDRKRAKLVRSDFKIEVASLKLTWSNHASNTHAAPQGGVTNWIGDADKPSGYPGWTGRIRFRLSHDVGFSSGIFKETCLHTHSGGGGEWVEYGITLFDSDWPGLSQARVFHLLTPDADERQTMIYRNLQYNEK